MRLQHCIAILVSVVTMIHAADDPVSPTIHTAADLRELPLFPQPVLSSATVEPSADDIAGLFASVGPESAADSRKFEEKVEAYLVASPSSPFAASLHSLIGKFYRENGRYSLALAHWEQAWEMTQSAESGDAKQIADFTLANWVRLLGSLGRVDKLGEMFQATEQRTFYSLALHNLYLSTREAYPYMIYWPGVAYRCGTFALQNVTRRIAPEKGDATQFYDTPSPTNGFSFTELLSISDKLNLGLIGVYGATGDLIAPSVVHWRENHYAAILAQQDNKFLVSDPTFETRKWLDRDAILAEASGYYLIEAAKIPASWRAMDNGELDSIRGKGFIYNMKDPSDNGRTPPDNDCNQNNNQGSNGDTSSTGSNLNDPSDSSSVSTDGEPTDPSAVTSIADSSSGGLYSVGMPKWSVTEPFVSLWMHDTPLWYKPSHGPSVAFTIDRGQRNQALAPFHASSLGDSWRFKFQAWISITSSDVTNVTVHTSEGADLAGVADNSSYEYQSNSKVVITDPHLPTYEVQFKDGSKEVYGRPIWYSSSAADVFLTQRVDSFGRAVTINYYNNTNYAKILNIVDADSKTNQIAYDTTFTNNISQVTDPYNRSAYFYYTNFGSGIPQLASVTDVAGLSSSFVYDTTTEAYATVSSLITPYGTNLFNLVGGYDWLGEPTNIINRSALVTLPDGGTHLYVFRISADKLSPSNTNLFLPNSYTDTNQVPASSPVGTLDNTAMYYRNTWHWTPLQYLNLSTTNTDNFTTNDYAKARLKHWLHGKDNPSFLGNTISMEQEPSPDASGLIPGKMTWYDYIGKPVDGLGAHPEIEGTNIVPNAVIRVEPGGLTWYSFAQRDQYGHVTNRIVTYSGATGITTRTDRFIYSTIDHINLIAHVGPDGVLLSSNVYDGVRSVTNHFNALQEKTVYYYNGIHQLSGTSNDAGVVTTNIYFTSGTYSNWLSTSINVGLQTNSYTYTNGLIYTQTDPRGLIVTNSWDNLQRLTRSDVPGTGGGAYTTTYTYDKLDLVRVVDPMGLTNSFGYDSLRRRIAETNAVGTITRYGYCTCGSLLYVTNAFGASVQAVTSFTYDNAGHRTASYFPDAYSVTNRYDALDRLTVVSDANATTTNTYNVQYLVVAVSNALGSVQSAAYDIYDRPTNIVDVNGVTVTNTYDCLNRLLTATTVGAGTRTNVYNVRGLTNSFNELGFANVYTLDALGRATQIANGNGETTQFTYDPLGSVKTMTDGNGHITTWSYDAFGNLTNKTDAVTNVLRFQYDADLRVTNRWTPQKGNTSYAYNSAGSLTGVVYPTSPSLSYSYDALQRLSSMTDGSGSTIYLFDAAGQQLFEAGPFMDSYVSTSYSNRRRQVLEIQEASFGWWNQFHGYDAAGRLTSFANPVGNFSFTLGGSGAASPLVRKILFPSGSYVTNVYDSVARLTGTYLETSSNTVLNSHSYGYNNASLRTNMTATAGNFWTYGYDNASQLKTAIGKESGGVTNRLHEQFGYTYDAAGNLTKRTMNTMTNTFTPNNVNELAPITHSGFLTVAGTTTTNANSVVVNTTTATRYADASFAATGFSPTAGANLYTAVATDASGRSDTNAVTVNLPTSPSNTYDLNGNTINDGNLAYAYDDENQLIRITATNSWSTGFVYDGKMRLRFRYESNWLSSAWTKVSETRYIYDGMLLIQERDGNNVPTVTYTRGPDLASSPNDAGGIGGLVCRTDMALHTVGAAGAYNYYHSDGNGNVTAMVNDHQVPSAKYSYDPYGNTLSQSGSLADANRLRFSSKDIHQNSGLYYYGYRFYSPNIQRWLNRDPIQEEGGINLYAFVNNEPITSVDFEGEDAAGVGGGVGVGIGIGLGAVPWWFPPAGAAVVGGAIGIGIGNWLNENTAVGDIGTAIGNWICPLENNMGRNKPPVAQPGRKKQGREINEGKRKDPNWQPRGPQRPLKKHTPSRDHQR